MKIKDVEKRTGITSYNIRFYEKENLLIPKRNPVNGYREYTEEDILLLNRIKMLRMLDIPVSDIRKILYEKEALTSVLNTHLLKIKEEENRLRQNYFLCGLRNSFHWSIINTTFYKKRFEFSSS